MSILVPIISTAKKVSYSTTAVDTAAVMDTTKQIGQEIWQFVATTDSWIKQGTGILVTPVAKANLVDGETFTITVAGQAKVYEFDVNGTGVTAGRVQVNVSTDTTAATIGARMKTAIDANQPNAAWPIVTTDNTGTLTIMAPQVLMTITDTVADVGFLEASASPTASIGSGSMFVPAKTVVPIDGTMGPQIGVIRDAADGNATLTKCLPDR